MPKITMTLTNADAQRVAAALTANSDYSPDIDGFKQFLADSINEFVRKYELSEAQKAALATIVTSPDIEVT